MNIIKSNLGISQKTLNIIGCFATLGLSYGLIKIYIKRRKDKKRKSYPRDVVILHQFHPVEKCPSASPFCLKLETWLRMADIKYENDFVLLERSLKGLVPWITFNGVDISDSQFCIEYLTQYFGKDLSDHLNQIERSISRAYFKLIEESLRWCLIIHRFKYGKAEDIGIPYIFFKIVALGAIKVSKMQGYGRHTKEEMYDIGKRDLKALDDFLGKKKFLFGSDPCTEDATLFAFIAQFLLLDKGPLNKFLASNCLNLVRHFDTIKEAYWQDWDKRLLH